MEHHKENSKFSRIRHSPRLCHKPLDDKRKNLRRPGSLNSATKNTIFFIDRYYPLWKIKCRKLWKIICRIFWKIKCHNLWKTTCRLQLVDFEPERSQGLRRMLVDNYSVFYVFKEDIGTAYIIVGGAFLK